MFIDPNAAQFALRQEGHVIYPNADQFALGQEGHVIYLNADQFALGQEGHVYRPQRRPIRPRPGGPCL